MLIKLINIYIYIYISGWIHIIKFYEEVVYLIIEIIHKYDPNIIMLKLNKWEMMSGNLDNSKVYHKIIQIVKEINQTIYTE